MIPLPFTLLYGVQIYTLFLCFLSREDPLAFVGELVWWCWILSTFACLQSFWFLLHIWMRSLLGCSFFYFITLRVSCHSLWPEEFLLKDQLLSLWESPCMLFIVFPLLRLIFVLCVWSLLIWLKCVLRCFALGLSCFLDLGDYFLPHFREVFNYYLLKYFFMAFLFVFFFWDSWFESWGI